MKKFEREAGAANVVGVALSLSLAVLITACGSDSSPVSTQTDGDAGSDVSVTEIVTPGRANWSTGFFQAEIYAALVEELGYQVADPAENEYPPSEAYLAMANGLIDFWPNGWYRQHEVWHDETLPDGTLVGDHLVVVGHQLDDAGFQGLVITKSIAEQYDITSLNQINDDPELAALFDLDGDGLGDIFGCPEEWTCDNVIDEMIERNGWSNLDQTTLGYPGMVEDSLRRVRAGEPAIQYTWSPSSYLAELVPGQNVLWLSVGDEEHVLDGSTASGLDYTRSGPAPFGSDCSDDPCWPGWEVEDIRVTANAEFAAAHPDLRALFEVVRLDVDAIARQNARYEGGENTDADLDRHVEEWLTENRTLVDEWLAAALSAGT